MGTLFLARDNRLERLAAIKTIPPASVADHHMRARFLREVRVASPIMPPYVATVLDVVPVGEQLFRVMEYIEGLRLDKEAKSREIPLAEKLRLAAEIAEALTAVHEHGLVHRDVKPSKVMATPQGHVKLLDFGSARQVPERVVAPEPVAEVAETAETASDTLMSQGAVCFDQHRFDDAVAACGEAAGGLRAAGTTGRSRR
jgi:serine/threonine-protein kinase